MDWSLVDQRIEFWQAILNWPFLAFFGIIILILLYKKELGKLIARGGITLIWGDYKFSIAELPDKLDESFAPLVDDVTDLKDRLDNLERQLAEAQVVPENIAAFHFANAGAPSREVLTPEQKEQARQAMLAALDEGRYRWRSIDRLAVKALISEAQAQDLLRGMSEVVVSRGKSGRTIARLATR